MNDNLLDTWKVSKYVINVPSDDDVIVLDGYYSRQVEVEQGVYRTFELLLERINELEELYADEKKSSKALLDIIKKGEKNE